MTILISDNSPRISYTATAGQTVFTVPFEFFDNSDLNVFINDVLKTITTNYTVAGGSGSTGTVTLVTGATLGDVIVITRDVTLERVTDFPTSGPFQVASLNVELDKLVAMIADLQDLANRGLRLSDSDVTERLTLASTNERKGTVLAFNATTGAVEVGPTIADTNTVVQIKADIATVAGISANVTTVAGISSDVTTVAGVSSNVTTVAGQTTNMQNITDNLTDIQNAPTNATNAATSASNAASSETAAASSASSAATSETNAGTSATNAATSASSASSSASTATTKASEASTSAANAATSETNAATSETNAENSAVNAFSRAGSAFSSASSAFSSASSAASSRAAAEAARDSALAAFDNFDDKYLGEKASDPTVDNDGDPLAAGALYFNTTDDAMKVYNGTSWVESYVDGTSFVAKAGDTMTGDLVVNASIQSGPLTVTAGAFGYNGINIRDDSGSTTSSLMHVNGGFYISADQSLDNIQILSTAFNFRHPTKFVFENDVEIEGDLSFRDNDKAIFGAGSDLEIYHDGSNSYIDEAGDGVLFVKSSNGIYFNGKTTDEPLARFIENGAVTLYHDNSAKISTTASGINVTGNVVSEVAINAQTGTTYTTVLSDQSKLVTLNNASAIALTIPANSSVAYPVGTQIDLSQFGAGQVTVAGAGGVTVNSASGLKLRAQYSSASCVKVATDTWLLVGDLEA